MQMQVMMQQVLFRPHTGLFGFHPEKHVSANVKLRVRDDHRLQISKSFAAPRRSLCLCLTPPQAQYGTRETGRGYVATAVEDAAEINMKNLVAKRLEETARHFKGLGSLGFWSQFLCTIVSAGILSFSIYVSGTATAPLTKYLTAAGIAMGFISVFWSFGYMRLSGRLEGAVGDPSKAPPRTQVVDKLKTGIFLNVTGLALTLLGLQATVGLLVAKALNSPAAPFLQGPSAGQSPVLALDVFLVQACANALLSHFFGLVFNLELLRSVSNKPPPQQKVILQAT